MKNKHIFKTIVFIFLFLLLPIQILAQDLEEDEELDIEEKGDILQEKKEEDSGDIMLFGLELEKLISFINGIIATVLFFITFTAFNRKKTRRLFFVSIAFALYAIRSFLVSTELFAPEIPWADPTAVVLDLIILLAFFYAILKK